MTANSQLWTALLRIRKHAQLSAIDRELLRPWSAAKPSSARTAHALRITCCRAMEVCCD